MSEECVKIVSKVLVHENDEKTMGVLKEFFNTMNLIGLKAERYSNIQETLDTNIDLGAVFLYEGKDQDGRSGMETALEIHKVRPELAVFLRRDERSDLSDLPQDVQKACAGAYLTAEIDNLKELVEKYLFTTYYPSAMVRGVEELSEEALHSTFQNLKISVESPYLIRDRIIYGELFSLIPLESNWCRGYMMIQAQEANLSKLITEGKTALSPSDVSFRKVNSLMSELTNMIWGSFKAKFFQSSGDVDTTIRIQVPIIIDHMRRYISFGADDPQLCFHYILQDNDGKMEPVSIYQKFIFHLNWSPEEFNESPDTMDNLVEAGELEFF